jgi:DNA topoisomerase-1
VGKGRFGPFVGAGTRGDVERPELAGVRGGQMMDTVTLDVGGGGFRLAGELGETADGEPMTVAIGQFGPYVKYGSKYVSLKEPDDPYTVTRERAIEVIEAKKVADANRIIIDFGVDDIQVLNGRYGPYITDKARNARIPKERDPKTMTLEECRALLAAAPPRPARGRFGRRGAPAKAKAAKAAAAPAADKPAPKVKAKAKAKAPAKKKASATAKTAAPAAAKAGSKAAKSAPRKKAAAATP